MTPEEDWSDDDGWWAQPEDIDPQVLGEEYAAGDPGERP